MKTTKKNHKKARKQVKPALPRLVPGIHLKDLSPPAYKAVNRGPEVHASRWLPEPQAIHAEGILRRAA